MENRTVMKRSCILIVTVILSILLIKNLEAFERRWCDEGLRCSGEIVSLGDRKSDVMRKCGEPTDKDTWEEERIRIRSGLHRRYRERELAGHPASSYIIKKVTVEEWTYNFGPHQFIYYLKFENNKLRCIESGDYGY